MVYSTCQLGISSSAACSELMSNPRMRTFGASKLASLKRLTQASTYSE
ncbi:Uncharacterised protein [Vibrio cholerae]|nr:Uncharacterised protein [Vibrio cholerae]